MSCLSKKEFEELKKKVEPVKKLAMHNDADGISAGVLLSFILNIKKVWSPPDFGEWPIKPYKLPGKEEFEMPPDMCVDMVPQDPQWEGLAIDHHPGHPSEAQRKYQLIFGDVPASVVVYRCFRDYIPPEQRWKVVVGAVGDVQPETVPPEVWREHPELLEGSVTLWKKYGKYSRSSPLSINTLPLYCKLSSGINAACKIPDKWFLAYSVLRNAKSPWELLKDASLKTAKTFVKDQHDKVLEETSPILLRNGILFWSFSSEVAVERTLAWELCEKEMKTVVAINEYTGRGSIRGVLATLVYEHFAKNGLKASGHPGFGGLRLKQGQTADDIYKILVGLKL